MARFFKVHIDRSAVETASLAVFATSQSDAEERIAEALNTAARIDLDDLAKMEGVRVDKVEFTGDDESSWEVV